MSDSTNDDRNKKKYEKKNIALCKGTKSHLIKLKYINHSCPVRARLQDLVPMRFVSVIPSLTHPSTPFKDSVTGPVLFFTFGVQEKHVSQGAFVSRTRLFDIQPVQVIVTRVGSCLVV